MSRLRRLVGPLSMLVVALMALTVGGGAAIAAPYGYPTAQTTLPAEILRATWTLQYFNTDAKAAGQDVSSSNITINFGAIGTLSGSGGCNSYSGSYTVSGQQMTISDKLTSTQVFCGQPVMSQESLYFRLLPTVNAYRMNQGKLDLIYSDGHNAMTFISGASQGGTSGQGGANSLPADILQTEWTLQHFTNAGAQDVSTDHITIKFESDGTLSGNGGCNNYFGTYTVSNLQLTIGQDLGSTMMFCEGPVMTKESLYFRLLTSVNSYQITNGNLQLIYGTRDNPNMLTYVSGTGAASAGTSELPAEIVGTSWTLESLAGQEVTVAGITIKFNHDGTFTGYDGCNSFSGSYTVDGGKLAISNVASTRKVCPESDPSLQGRFLELLGAVQGYTLNNGQLTLDSQNVGSSTNAQLDVYYQNVRNALVFVRTTRANAVHIQSVVTAGMPTTGVPTPITPTLILLLLVGSLALLITGVTLRRRGTRKAVRR